MKKGSMSKKVKVVVKVRSRRRMSGGRWAGVVAAYATQP
jgi:hypothetical protein